MDLKRRNAIKAFVQPANAEFETKFLEFLKGLDKGVILSLPIFDLVKQVNITRYSLVMKYLQKDLSDEEINDLKLSKLLDDLVVFEGFHQPLFVKTQDWKTEQMFKQFALITFIEKSLKEHHKETSKSIIYFLEMKATNLSLISGKKVQFLPIKSY